MKIIEKFNTGRPVISFEIFPPKEDAPLESIYSHLNQFAELKPDYISVTYGAGGSQKGKTMEIASKIKHDLNIESMAHFTCLGNSRQEVESMLFEMHSLGLENILALRGDLPLHGCNDKSENNDYFFASDLVSHIQSNNGFCIAAAAYAEGHVDCAKLSNDIANLKVKVDSGVDFLITQLFFDNRLFYDLVEKAAASNINCPIAAGVMPLFKGDQIKSICAKSGCSIPAKLVILMDKYHDNPEDLRKAGIEYAGNQIRGLLDNGAAGIHLYTMNRPVSSKQILEAAGVI